jgi:hypothetical protein
MFRYAPLFALIASPAAAHQTPLPHVHGAEAGLWLGLALISVVGIYVARAKVKESAEAKRRSRRP